MQKQLYRVEFTGVCYVMAYTPEAAEAEALYAVNGDPQGAGVHTDGAELVAADDVLDWEPGCLPYGIDHDEPEISIGKIQKALKEATPQ